jgi:hypothetical protein
MPTNDEFIAQAEEIISASRGTITKIHDLFSGAFNLNEIYEVLVALVQSAEAMLAVSGMGAMKHKAVKEVFDQLDAQYGLIDKLDAAIRLPFWAEPFDGKVLRVAVNLLISLIVTSLNATGVFKH